MSTDFRPFLLSSSLVTLKAAVRLGYSDSQLFSPKAYEAP